ncbi:MAG: exonuclease domain-containing protein [Breznakibacter sp.]
MTLSDSMYSIIDVETTGGPPDKSKITEIAIYRVHNGKIADKFVTLINPERYIPDYITRLTGISNEMVEHAPRFFEVARRVIEITRDSIFVAHNVSFDFNIVKAEFDSLGYSFDLPQLCTVKLSRSLIPGHRSYSLGNLCNDIGIVLNERHRAGGDALATVELFLRLLEMNGGVILPDDPYKRIDFTRYPNHINKDFINAIPNLPGVYYLKNVKNEIVYVGKSKRIRARIIEHLFGSKSSAKQSMSNEIHDVDYTLTGSELLALLKEAEDIKSIQPKYNKVLKRRRNTIGVYDYTDRKGYIRLLLKPNDGVAQPIASFQNTDDARRNLFKWIDEFSLCQKLCGLYDGTHGCFNYQLKQCLGACVGAEEPDTYNERVRTFIAKTDFGYKNLIVIDKGRTDDEVSLVVVEDGRYLGYGYLPIEESISNPSEFKDYIKQQENDRDARLIIKAFLHNNKPLRLIEF